MDNGRPGTPDYEAFEFQTCVCLAERINHYGTHDGYGFYLRTDER